jgi:dienelactone hydrolase
LKDSVKVGGKLSLPEVSGRAPAVLVLHSRAGIDGTGMFYAEALNRAGIATLEIQMFQGAAQMPRDSRQNLPHAFGALKYLAENPAIDAERIGVMGFSRGGGLAIMTATQSYDDMYTNGKLRFAAHLSLYPACVPHQGVAEGKWMAFEKGAYDKWTGKPVHILAGEQDDYDVDADACQRFVQSLPVEARSNFGVTVYPGVTHGWEIPGDRTYYHDIAFKGKGGNVRYRYDSKTAEQSRQFAVDFFRKAFGS